MGPNPQETADLVLFTEEILNGKLHFLCSAMLSSLDLKIKLFPINWLLLWQTFFSPRENIRQNGFLWT